MSHALSLPPDSESVIPATVPVFLPTTSALVGGVLLRRRAHGRLELLLPNYFSAGVTVSSIEQFGGFGYRPTLFDGVLMERIAASRLVSVGQIEREVLNLAAAGLAGRTAETQAARARQRQARQHAMLVNRITARLAGIPCAPGQESWLASVFLHTGTLSGSGRIPRKLALIRRTANELDHARRHAPPDGNVHFLAGVAGAALARMDMFYRDVLALFETPLRLASLRPETPSFLADLSLLQGWIRFCLLMDESHHSPSPPYALADLVSLAQLLTHRAGIAGDDLSFASIFRPKISQWPRELDRNLYMQERNERVLREELILSAAES